MKAAYYLDVGLEQMVPDQIWIDEEYKYDIAVIDWWKPLEEERPATPKPAWSIPSSDVPILKNNWASALASTYLPPPKDSLLAQTGDIAMFIDWFYLEYLRYSSKGGRPALSISKMKATCYPDAGLEQMVPDQIQRFYIDKHTSEGDRRADMTHMRILSIVRIEFFSMYGYHYMKKIVLRQEDLNEHLGIESYKTQLNLTKPRWDASGFEYKHDYTVIDSPRAVTFQDRYGVQMIMRFNEIHKFSDVTLQQIDEALDYRVKEFKVNRMNPGLNTRF
nr:hypothetical protein [Tanacetum cinerariifolium]